ncbi:NAD(P)-dependent oxidoreductase [Dactylosporangium sp. NPDC050588]|uniref:NAD(P)-dependent oxidoreductase n=1 Tax=Dactylosporangium sp. NPDC050588 TaxID=3157211 RepID=UPI0033E9890E
MNATGRPVVGFVGLGVMGSAMAGNVLARGAFEVHGYDIDADRRRAFTDAGGVVHDDLASLVAAGDLVLTSLPSAAAFESVLGGLVEHARPGTVVVETSTLDLRTKLDGAARLARTGVEMLDCPLSGTGAQARAGDLVAYVSGAPEAVGRARSLVEAFTRAHFELGEVGNGTLMKLVANHLVAVHNVAAAEALGFAQDLGLDLWQVLAAVGDGAGGSRMLGVRGPDMVRGRYEPASIRMDVFAKDLEIIGAAAAEAGTVTPLFDAARAVYRDGLSDGLVASDTAVVFEVLRGHPRPRDPAPSGRRASESVDNGREHA